MALEDGRLFLRSGQLIVGPKVGTTNGAQEPSEIRTFFNRLSFKIDKSTDSTGNKSNIKIYNISQDSRDFVENLGPDKNKAARGVVFLKAGYTNDIGTIFFGDILRIITERTGPDIITTLECGDGQVPLQQKKLEIGLGKGATNIQVMQIAAATLNTTLGVTKGIVKREFLNGYSFSGFVKDLLDDMTKQAGVEWNIQDGELQIFPPDSSDGQEAVVVTPQNRTIRVSN